MMKNEYTQNGIIFSVMVSDKDTREKNCNQTKLL